MQCGNFFCFFIDFSPYITYNKVDYLWLLDLLDWGQYMNTFRINTSLAEPGMVVAEDIYSFSDQMIIGAGTILTDRMISRLKFYSISDLLIMEVDPSVPESTESPADSLPYIKQTKKNPDFHKFSNTFSSSLSSCKKQLDIVLEQPGALPDTEALIQDVTSLFQSCQNPSELFDMMMCIRDLDDATYVHSLNVALICNLFGVWLKFPKEDCRSLVLAGLLHDIGKKLVPKILLTKPEKLTDEEFTTVRAHSLYGYNILKDLPLDPRVKLAALMHHERCDGSGYPMGLTADKIDPFAKIVAIADVYDAMTAARVYRGPICPLEVIGIFEAEGFQKYDPEYLLTFLENVAHTYLHYTVLLSTGEKAEIVLTNRNSLSRPLVRTENDQFIDLAKQPDIAILGIL